MAVAIAIALFLATALKPGLTGEGKVEGWH
jgi:hypothetical protein